MRVVIQQVLSASLWIEGTNSFRDPKGLAGIVGYWDKMNNRKILIISLRKSNYIFWTKDQMNLSVMDIDGEILLVNQFTFICKSTKRATGPSLLLAANPSEAKSWYEVFIKALN